MDTLNGVTFGNYDVFAWYVYNNAFEGDWIDNPDIAYMEAVYNELSTQYNIDKSRVFTSGHSRGLLSPSLLHLNDRTSLLDTVHKRDLVQPTTTIFGLRNYSKAVPSMVLIHGDADPDVRVVESMLFMTCTRQRIRLLR